MESELNQVIQQGRHAFERRNYADALAAFREVLRENPNFADVRHLTGLCLSFLGQPEAALAEFDEAIKLNERYVEAHLNRAIVLTELGRYDDAQRAFEHAGRYETEIEGPFPALISARLANAHMSVGDLYLEAGAPTQAADEYRTALTMRPRFHDVRNKLAQALLQLGDLDGAAIELQTVLNGNSRFLAARLNLGLVHYRRGDLDAAAREWEICREQQPSNPQVRAYLAMLERAASEPASNV
ncbi:MAG TPA: tetratricopeptide repeat protein [Longimicrobiales bacterium]|nr:tetratricopeptide repeat protein [Longimicrobiales bacterium]